MKKPPPAPDAAVPASDAAPLRMNWPARARRVRAQAFDPGRGRALLAALWRADRQGLALGADEVERLAGHFDYFAVPEAQAVIGQDEAGDYLLVVLEGRLAVERLQADGKPAWLAEARAGDLLGEMALLDAGARFSACTTLTPCVLAVLSSERLDRLMAEEPRLALALLASLARRLSLRLREVSTRLSALLAAG